MATDFNQLNREAFDRGLRDYERQLQRQGRDRVPVPCTNPYAGNPATDESVHWAEGWESANHDHRLQLQQSAARKLLSARLP